MKRLLLILGLLACLAAIPAHAQTFVQQKDCEQVAAVSTFGCVMGSATGSGHSIYVVMRVGNTSATALAVSGSTQGSLTMVTGFPLNDATNGRQFAVFYKDNTTASGGAETFTCSWSTTTAGNDQCSIFEYSGMNTTNSLDQHTVSTCPLTTTTTPNSGNLATTSQANELLIGSLIHSSGDTITTTSESTSFTACAANGCLNDTEGTASHPHQHTSTRIVSATGTYNYQPTESATVVTCVAIVSFKAAGGATCTPTLTLLGVGRCG